MPCKRSQQLQQILLLSQEMLAKAGDHEWGLVAEIEARRSELVARCFQQPAQQQHAGEVAAAIREILQLNRKISDLGERYRREKEYEQAIAAYSQVTKSGMDYEKAVVWIAVCKYRMGQRDAGYGGLQDYLTKYVTDATNTVQGAKEVKRDEAMEMGEAVEQEQRPGHRPEEEHQEEAQQTADPATGDGAAEDVGHGFLPRIGRGASLVRETLGDRDGRVRSSPGL
mgnify:CR=1 FL=1